MDVADRVEGACGELVLRTVGEHFEIIANGTFLMDTRGGASERLLASAALDACGGTGRRVLLGGLGVGFTLRAALDHPATGEVVVVEREPAVIDWNRGPLRGVHGDALADPRVRCVRANLVTWLAETDEHFDAICLDIDNGPEWTVVPENSLLYKEPGVDTLARRLAGGGVLAVWSAAPSTEFRELLASRFTTVRALEVAVARGAPDVVYLAGNGS